jgi:hypothetical protein
MAKLNSARRKRLELFPCTSISNFVHRYLQAVLREDW